MAELPIEVEIVIGPDHGNRAMLQDFGIPHAFEPAVGANAQAFDPPLIRNRARCSVRPHRNKRGVGKKQWRRGVRIVSGHSIKQALDYCAGALIGNGCAGEGVSDPGKQKKREFLHRASVA